MLIFGQDLLPLIVKMIMISIILGLKFIIKYVLRLVRQVHIHLALVVLALLLLVVAVHLFQVVALLYLVTQVASVLAVAHSVHLRALRLSVAQAFLQVV